MIINAFYLGIALGHKARFVFLDFAGWFIFDDMFSVGDILMTPSVVFI